jgi:hypothetical protein
MQSARQHEVHGIIGFERRKTWPGPLFGLARPGERRAAERTFADLAPTSDGSSRLFPDVGRFFPAVLLRGLGANVGRFFPGRFVPGPNVGRFVPVPVLPSSRFFPRTLPPGTVLPGTVPPAPSPRPTAASSGSATSGRPNAGPRRGVPLGRRRSARRPCPPFPEGRAACGAPFLSCLVGVQNRVQLQAPGVAAPVPGVENPPSRGAPRTSTSLEKTRHSRDRDGGEARRDRNANREGSKCKSVGESARPTLV